MKTIEQLLRYIPLDKSWIIRMAILDLRFGKARILQFLADYPFMLSDDLKALLNACLAFPLKDQVIDVGESGTLFRFLQFLVWTKRQERIFIKKGTLLNRQITNDRSIIDWPIKKLLTLDNSTSQWASAAVLSREDEPIRDIAYQTEHKFPNKLCLTYEAVAHWRECEKDGSEWQPRFDITIQKQVEAFIRMVKGGSTDFIPIQAEDYCFARAFGFMSADEGLARWPSLVGHESNRIEEMEAALYQTQMGFEVRSADHRVVQAIAMFNKIHGHEHTFTNPKCVGKSWPLFWEFMFDAAAL